MGQNFSHSLKKITRSHPKRLIIVGLDSAGKTTLLYRLKFGEVNILVLRIGFLYESVQNRRFSIISWDVGFSDNRPLYNQFYENAEGVIFVVDSNDRSRIDYSRDELQKIMYNEKLSLLPLLVYANKQDIKTAMSAGEIADKLGIRSDEKSCRVQGSCNINGYGIFEGLEWIEKAIQENANDKIR